MKQLHIILFLTFLIASCSTRTTQLSVSDSKRGDAVFSLIVPNNNYGQIENIHIYSWTQGGILNVNRVLIDFDFDAIPKSAKINKAVLNLYFNPTSKYDEALGGKGNHGTDSIIVQRVTSDWHENKVTWNTQPKTTTENQVILTNMGIPHANYQIDITDIIKDIIENRSERYGIMIRYKNEVPYNVSFFASSNHPDIKLHPTLKVSYR